MNLDRNKRIGDGKTQFPLFRYRRIPRNKELPPELDITIAVGPWTTSVLVAVLTLIAAELDLELPAPSSLMSWFR